MKLNKFDIIALISGIVFILISIKFDDFWDYLFFITPYAWILILLFFLLFVSIAIFKSLKNIRTLIIHFLIIGIVIISQLYDKEWFRSEPVIIATLKDDLNYLELTLRKDNSCQMYCVGMFGFSNKFDGKYIFVNDKIVFLVIPYDNNFIPDTLYIFEDKLIRHFLINNKQDLSFASYFEIQMIDSSFVYKKLFSR